MAQQTRPFIGINADFVPAGKSTQAHVRLSAGYFDGVLAAGGLPVIIPPLGKETEIHAILDRLDGVILSGGRIWIPAANRCRRIHLSSPCPNAARRTTESSCAASWNGKLLSWRLA